MDTADADHRTVSVTTAVTVDPDGEFSTTDHRARTADRNLNTTNYWKTATPVTQAPPS